MRADTNLPTKSPGGTRNRGESVRHEIYGKHDNDKSRFRQSCGRGTRLGVSTPMACAGLGARLFQTRREAGLGLIRLGKLAGVSHSTIGDIEKGRQLPAVDTVERLARALKVRASWLAFGDGGREA